MEIKNLLNKLKNADKEVPETFFAVEITEDAVKSAVWTVIDGHTKVVKIGVSKSWDGQSQEQLLAATDQSISDASDNLPQEPCGVVFGLPETWLEKQEISQPKKKFLKYLCTELELKPLGYVVTDNAVVQYLKIEEGTPPSAIFLQLNSTEINLSLVKLGQTIGTQLVGRSGDLGPDVEEGLSRFKSIDTFPARMILYNGQSDFEEDKQQLLSYDWEEKLPFIHFPKVESLPPDASIKAVALAGGSEVAKSLGFTIKPQKTKTTPETDVSNPAEKLTTSPTDSVSDSRPVTAQHLGFTTGDIADQLSVSSPQTSSSSAEGNFEPDSDVVEPSIPVTNNVASPTNHSSRSAIFMSTLSWIKSLSHKFSDLKNKLPFIRQTPKTLTLVTVGFVILLIAILVAYWYLPKAKVIIFVEPKTAEEDLNITIDAHASSMDVDQAVLPGELVDISVEGQKTITTTGTVLVGDQAQGNITIYNKTNQSKTFSQGTVLVGLDNLAFTLDDDTTIASSSSRQEGEDIIISPGKATAKLTAKSIGPESNLAADTKLTFKQFSEDDYYAKVDGGLSGGTAREVKAVSEEDQAVLLDEITADLQQKAEADLQSKLGDDRQLVDLKDQDQLITKTYNHDVGEEADSLTLAAKLAYTALAYRQNDLQLLLQAVFKDKIPENFQLSQSSQIDLQPTALNSNDTADVNVIFKAQLIPKIDFQDFKNNIKGKYPHIIEEYLTSLPGFIKADITITPKLPDKLKTLPRVAKNITVEISTSP